MRRYHYIFIFIAFLVSCEPLKHSDPYAENLNALTVTVVYPEGFADIVHEGVPVLIEDMNSRAKYSGITDASGVVRLNLPDGLYRLNASDRKATDVFNGAADKVAVSGGPVNLRLPMAHSKTGAIIIKEIYCGGCKKLPQEGDYQSDQYFIFQNPVTLKRLEVLDLYVYRLGLINKSYSYSTAIGMIKSLISLVMIFGTNQLAKKIRGNTII